MRAARRNAGAPVVALHPATSASVATPTRARRSLVVAGAVLGGCLLVVLLVLASARSLPGDSDGATVVLEGKAMAAGHLLLGGWRLSLDSFWAVDAVFYTVAAALVGVRAELVHVVPAVIGALVVVVGVALARHGSRGVAALAGAVTVVVLLGFPSHYLSVFFLRGPYHVGTVLWALVAFYALRRGRWGLGWWVAVVFLAAGLLGDLQIVSLGMAPIVGAGLVTMARRRSWGSGLPLVATAPAAAALALVARTIARAVGTYSIGGVQGRASFTQMAANLRRLPVEGAHLLGVGGGVFGTGGVPSGLQAVHVVGLAVVVVAGVVAAGRLVDGAVRGRDDGDGRALGDDLLVLAVAGGCVTYVALALSTSEAFDRYLTSAVVFGSVLAGRQVARAVAAVRGGARRRAGRPVLVRGMAVAGVAVAAALAAAFGLSLGGPAAPSPVTGLVRFLEAHHLHRGLGDYWSASITTVVSDGRVVVRPVITDTTAKIAPYGRQSSAGWYGGRFQFLVYSTVTPGNVDASIAAATFGPPSATYAVGRYRVLVWPQPITGVAARPAYDPLAPG